MSDLSADFIEVMRARRPAILLMLGVTALSLVLVILAPSVRQEYVAVELPAVFAFFYYSVFIVVCAIRGQMSGVFLAFCGCGVAFLHLSFVG